MTTQKAPALPAPGERLYTFLQEKLHWTAAWADLQPWGQQIFAEAAAKEPALPPGEPVAWVDRFSIDAIATIGYQVATLTRGKRFDGDVPLYTSAALPAESLVNCSWKSDGEFVNVHMPRDQFVRIFRGSLPAAPDVNGAEAAKQGADNE